MKRLFTLTLTFFLALNVFAQNDEYKQHIEKAKEYETNEQWIHALGEYWDAMAADNDNAITALNRWFEIAESIKSGKPGIGEYDEFDTYDCWAELQEEYEDYWYEDCPLYFNFSDFEKGELDYETRTASYSIKLNAEWTPKYKRIKDIVSTGYKKAFRYDWKLEENWPSVSCRNNGDKVISNYYGEYNLATYVTDKYYYDEYYGSQSNYIIKCSIVGPDDLKIVEEAYIGDGDRFVIYGVDRKGIKVFDSKNVKIIPEKVMLYINSNSSEWNPVTDRYEYKRINKDLVKDTNIVINTPDNTPVLPVEVTKKLMVTSGKIYKMVKVPGGSFSMGSSKSYNADQKPVHTVTVSSFEMGATEVTNELYNLVMDIDGDDNSYDSQNVSKMPKSNVSWNKAIYFCNKLSEICGYTPCYKLDGESDVSKWNISNIQSDYIDLRGTVTCDFTANGFRLPTEAEWEYAAVEGSKNSSYTYSGSNDINVVAWYYDNSNNKLHEVATKKANAIGLYDLCGNVWEWCWDYYSYDYYSNSPAKNPYGPTNINNGSRVLRGGGFDDYYYSDSCRVVYRGASEPGYGSRDRGFRLVRSSK